MKHNILITILVILALTVIGLVAYIALMPQPVAAPVATEQKSTQQKIQQNIASTDSVSQDMHDTVDEENDFAQYAQYDRQIDLFHLDDEKKVLVDEASTEHSVECEKKMDERINRNEPNESSHFITYNDGGAGVLFLDWNEETIARLYQNDYNVIDGCLYKNGSRAMKYSLHLYARTNFFGEIDENNLNARLGTTNLNEWFRFSRDGKLHVFLWSGAGCGGCVFNGRYLQIDQKTGAVEGKYVDMPYMMYLILSPDRTQAIHSVMSDNDGADLYLYDFIALKDTKKLYTVPQGKILYAWGDGPWLFDDAITWNDGDVYVQLYEKIGDTGDWMNDYIKSGTPIKIDLK